MLHTVRPRSDYRHHDLRTRVQSHAIRHASPKKTTPIVCECYTFPDRLSQRSTSAKSRQLQDVCFETKRNERNTIQPKEGPSDILLRPSHRPSRSCTIVVEHLLELPTLPVGVQGRKMGTRSGSRSQEKRDRARPGSA